MDHNKNELLSSKNLLSAEYIPTPHGNVCKKMEIVCIKCGSLHDVTVPDDAIAKINSVDMIGTVIIEYILEELGWVQTSVKRKNGIKSIYTVCPGCVDKEYEAFKCFKL